MLNNEYNPKYSNWKPMLLRENETEIKSLNKYSFYVFQTWFLRSPQWWLVDWFISCSPLFRKIAEQVIFFDWYMYIDIHARYINIIRLIYRHILLSQYRVIQFSKNVSILIIPKITYWINYFMLIHTTDTIIPSTNASLCTNNIHTLI